MQLHNAIFEIIRQTSNVPQDEINNLEKKANDETRLYPSEGKGLKPLYARIHKGWIMQTLILLALPLIISKYIAYKNKMIQSPFESDLDDEEDIKNRLDLNSFL